MSTRVTKLLQFSDRELDKINFSSFLFQRQLYVRMYENWVYGKENFFSQKLKVIERIYFLPFYFFY